MNTSFQVKKYFNYENVQNNYK